MHKGKLNPAKIYVTGDIDEDLFRILSSEMDYIEAEQKHSHIEIIINSSGGTALDAIAMYERIKRSPMITNTTVFGACYSAAVLVLAAGQTRRITKESWVMVHEDSEKLGHTSTSRAEKVARTNRNFEDQWCRLLAENSILSAKEWARLHKEETYLPAFDCLNYGLVTEVI